MTKQRLIRNQLWRFWQRRSINTLGVVYLLLLIGLLPEAPRSE